jgi:hypothetical protein
MRKTLILTAVALIALAACSSTKKVYTANGATVTTDSSKNTVTVQSSEGTFKAGKGVVDVASLGVPIYGGATEDEGAFSVSGAKGSGQMVAFTTGDSFDKVYQFYHEKMPSGSEKMKMEEGDSSVAEFVTGDEKPGALQTMVMISKKGNQTSIVITKGSSATK